MSIRAILECKVENLNDAIDQMERHNDDSVGWVNEYRELLIDLQEAEEALAECGGYREADSRW